MLLMIMFMIHLLQSAPPLQAHSTMGVRKLEAALTPRRTPSRLTSHASRECADCSFRFMPVRGQDTWQLNRQNSIARLSLGSRSNALEMGLARVNGDVVFASSDPADPVISIKINPAMCQPQSMPR
jgi:hypothetical protein